MGIPESTLFSGRNSTRERRRPNPGPERHLASRKVTELPVADFLPEEKEQKVTESDTLLPAFNGGELVTGQSYPSASLRRMRSLRAELPKSLEEGRSLRAELPKSLEESRVLWAGKLTNSPREE